MWVCSKRLARLGEVTITDAVQITSGDPVIEVGGTRLQLQLGTAGADWRQRLDEEVERLVSSHAKLRAKLDNSDFVARAPSEVVTKQRLKVEEEALRLAAVQELARVNRA